MDSLCNYLLKQYKEIIKTVSGKGPRNIFYRYDGNIVQLHFWINKTPIEEYILRNFEDGEKYLYDMYLRISQMAYKEFVEVICNERKNQIRTVDFSINVLDGKFCLILEKVED
jgi:hypothetical protein